MHYRSITRLLGQLHLRHEDTLKEVNSKSLMLVLLRFLEHQSRKRLYAVCRQTCILACPNTPKRSNVITPEAAKCLPQPAIAYVWARSGLILLGVFIHGSKRSWENLWDQYGSGITSSFFQALVGPLGPTSYQSCIDQITLKQSFSLLGTQSYSSNHLSSTRGSWPRIGWWTKMALAGRRKPAA